MLTLIIIIIALIGCLIISCFTDCKTNVSLERLKCESYIETKLFDALINKGFTPRTQVKCGPYRIDIVIGNLAIECDGEKFHSSPKQKKYDGRKNCYLRRNGYKVCRISGKSIVNNIGRVINHIEKRALN